MSEITVGRAAAHTFIGSAPRCSAKNRLGERCGSYAIRGGTVCPTHGGSIPAVKEAARRRMFAMLEPALAYIDSVLKQRPPCPTCGRTDAHRDPVALRAAQMILDRTGLHPTVTLQQAEQRAPEGDQFDLVNYLTEDQVAMLAGWISDAKSRWDAEQLDQALDVEQGAASFTEQARYEVIDGVLVESLATAGTNPPGDQYPENKE